MAAAAKPAKPAYELSGWERFKKDVVRDKWLYLLIFPGMLFMLIFRYIPIFGNVIAFMDFNPYNMWNSTWVGFDQFIKLFNKPAFMQTFYNTLYISILKMVCGFPIPIILALMMNEMRNMKFKKVAQTLLYLPHFISWVVMAGLIMNFLDPSTGLITALLKSITGKDLQVLTDKALFVPMLIITDIYKTMGWGTIIYFAALSGVDPQLYEAAEIDGARKWKQMLNITLPAITPTIVIMLILNCNNIVNAGFDQIFMLYSALVYDVTDSNLNHTGIYLYSKGKIMIHLTFDYKTDEKCTTPGQYLKYHRTFQGLSTRELAEKVGIVPATLVLYENDRHPIKHSTAVALANALGIDRNRLLDKYTAFVDYPYSSLLKKVRQDLSLTQIQMAELIGIGQTSYSGWEREIRVPRRKEYDKILAALEKLRVNVDTYLCQSASI